MSGDELSFDDARAALRQYGGWPLLRASFTRFRYGDGFSHARGFGLQLALAAVPLVIAMTGLAGALGAEGIAQVVARTAVAVSPGRSDQVVEQTVRAPEPGSDSDDAPGEDVGEVALTLGLLAAFAATASAFAQLERGANRIYGVERDRPALAKYSRAALLTVTAGAMLAAGLLLIVAGGPFGDAVEDVFRWGSPVETAWDVVRWPAGLLLLMGAVTLLYRYAPRRNQPGSSWLAVGAGVTVLGWLGASGLLALYVSSSPSFGDTYGPLTAVMALLIWANVSGVALLGGIALSAQLEAVRAGQADPLLRDSDGDGIPDDLERHAEPRRVAR
jgi:YihY family inner membrane protein